jgi:hypothetical protein
MCVLTGAGISAESGVPTFRGDNGLWKKFRPEELANFEAFIRNPELVWEWYNYRRQLIENVIPNPGHVALAQIEQMSTISIGEQGVKEFWNFMATSREVTVLTAARGMTALISPRNGKSPDAERAVGSFVLMWSGLEKCCHRRSLKKPMQQHDGVTFSYRSELRRLSILQPHCLWSRSSRERMSLK